MPGKCVIVLVLVKYVSLACLIVETYTVMKINVWPSFIEMYMYTF